ncbi:hypothetical protein Rs2_25748 [Raphanus sativus]|uniref:GBF-interacting protein 1 isoform X2 n=1 Tax=Raphanus sativus TaxID=3726 RepID=A0A6J0JY38_RAPSA|nr:GBF-interacting protein 1 isoform X2 [Raphanus sativus]KAJ4886000.1 hypothetical protein Rs2_25748 [Raphanus sativus]
MVGGGGGGGGARVSIPAKTRKTIQNIKEITAGNYSEEEIHAMLLECNMDPDETTQRLLLQDPFLEVKKKRDKRKESLSNKESVEPQWRSGGPGRGGRGGRVNFSSRHSSHDGAGAKNSFRKENGPKQVTDPSSSTSQETKAKDNAVSSHSAVMDKSAVSLTSGSSDVNHPSNRPARSGQGKATGSSVPSNSIDVVALGVNDVHTEQKSAGSLPLPRPSSSEVRFTSSNPKSMSDQTSHEQHIGEGKFHNRARGVVKNAVNDAYVPRPASSHSNSTGSRPSSNYSNRSHQTAGPQRGKEWKPKPVNHNTTQGSGASATTETLVVPTEASEKSVEDVVPSAEGTSILQRQLEDLQIQRQHVIIPNHILVPEAERTKFSFGSFGAGFSITSSTVAFPETKKSSVPLSQNSQEVEDSLEEDEISHPTGDSTEKEEDNNVYSESSSQVPNDMAGEGITATDAAPEYDVSKQENILESEGNQNSFDHVPSNMIGLVPPAPGSQLPQFENADPQARDALRIPNFVVQQPFDTASYYAQFYRSGPDSDGRVSPFTASKFNGNVTALPPHSSQTMQEGGNNLVLSTASPTPLATQAAGLMQSSIPVSQQPVPVFRPPGLHMSHYPPNYMPYGHYFSPFYPPLPTMHPFLSNGAFAQQPQASGVYHTPPPPGAAAGNKYTLPHYKPGTNTGNLAHVGMPGGYGPPYGSFPAGYNNPTSAASAGNSNTSEDLSTLQLKENNGYNTTGQQSEALPVWIAGPGRDVPSSFYGLQHHGQHVTYAPAQAGHVAFPGMYHHPGQAVTAGGVHHPLLQQSQGGGVAGGAEMVAPGPNVFQQPQQTQMNWPSNY